MRIKHCAVLAGLVGTLALGGISAPATAYADDTVPASVEGTASDGDRAVDGNTPEEGTVTTTSSDGVTDDFSPASTGVTVPTDYDKADFYEAAPLASALSAAPTARAAVTGATDEMKYFTLYESGQNYDQGFSKWDSYHAMGYYQFDRRYSLVSLMRSCYEYDSVTFAMFKPLIDRAAELSSANTVIFDAATRRLTEIGQLAEDAWHAAYAADTATFAALQDAYAISNYYQPTERWLKSELGIDMSGRADCVKGLVWSFTNLFGTGGVKDCLRAANLTNDMSDREFVNAIVDSLPSSLAKYNTNTKYHQSWINRYEKERATCLSYIAEDEAAVETPSSDVAVDEGNQNNQVDSTESAEPGAQNSTNEDGLSNDAVTTPQPVPPASNNVVTTPKPSTPVEGSATTVKPSTPAADSTTATEPSIPGNESDDAADTVNNNTADNGTDDTVDRGESSTVDDAQDSANDDTADKSDTVETSGNQSGENSTGDEDGASSKTADNGGDTQQKSSSNDGKTIETTSNTAKNGSDAQNKAADANSSLPQTGDASSLMFAATTTIAALGGASLSAGKRLARNANDNEVIE